MKPALSRLTITDWLLICIALSLVGTLVMSLFVVATRLYPYPKDAYANPYFVPAMVEQSAIILFVSLIANFLGAAALVTFFAVRRHVQGR